MSMIQWYILHATRKQRTSMYTPTSILIMVSLKIIICRDDWCCPYPMALTTVVCGWLLYGGCCGFITTLGSLSSTGLNIAINPFRTGAGAGGFAILCALFILLSVDDAKSIMIHTSNWVKTRFTSILFDLKNLASIDVIKATHNFSVTSVQVYYQSWLPMNRLQNPQYTVCHELQWQSIHTLSYSVMSICMDGRVAYLSAGKG